MRGGSRNWKLRGGVVHPKQYPMPMYGIIDILHYIELWYTWYVWDRQICSVCCVPSKSNRKYAKRKRQLMAVIYQVPNSIFLLQQEFWYKTSFITAVNQLFWLVLITKINIFLHKSIFSVIYPWINGFLPQIDKMLENTTSAAYPYIWPHCELLKTWVIACQ